MAEPNGSEEFLAAEYLSIIVTPGSGGLGSEFHGWVTHGQRGRYVCQPAVLRNRLGYCS